MEIPTGHLTLFFVIKIPERTFAERPTSLPDQTERALVDGMCTYMSNVCIIATGSARGTKFTITAVWSGPSKSPHTHTHTYMPTYSTTKQKSLVGQTHPDGTFYTKKRITH